MPGDRPGRRAFGRDALALALAAFGGRAAAQPASAPLPRFDAYPFALGVASGSPRAHGVVLWTRLATDPAADGGGLAPDPVELHWQIAADERFARVVRSGSALALAERAHSVHVEADGLEPGRWYWYRFIAGGGPGAVASPVGLTRTAPAPGEMPGRVRVCVASCQHYERGFFAAWRHLVDEEPDLVLHLGDYIYESNLQHEPVRRHWNPEPTTLSAYRMRHAQYRTDPDLQRAHALAPWLVTWDDHEVDNDYADDRAEDLAPDFLARRAAAYRAYFEHMPLRPSALPRGPDMRLHSRHGFGALAEFHMLDCRQYRSHQACASPGRGGSRMVEPCDEFIDPRRTMLGAAQERWLGEGLRASRARWNLIGQTTLLSRFDARPGPGEVYWTDGWSGYPAAAERLVGELGSSGARNPLILGGDVHTHYVCDVKADFSRPESATVATEFCCTSITSPSVPQSRIDALLPENPHVVLADATRRGYLRLTLEPDRCVAQLRVISDPRDPRATLATRASFVVEDGRPGARPA